MREVKNIKSIKLKVIPKEVSDNFIIKYHYSKKVVNKSCLHFGVFLDGQLHGAMSYGTGIDHRRIVGLVSNTSWNDCIELNRMAFDDYLPKNSESRAIAVSIKLIKKYAKNIKWIISFSDATQCGDGAIYRASGFFLTGIRKSNNLVRLTTGEVVHKISIESKPNQKRKELDNKNYFEITNGKYDFKKYLEYTRAEIIPGYQLRYIYFIDREYIKYLKSEIIPFSKIKEMGIGMYKGQKKIE